MRLLKSSARALVMSLALATAADAMAGFSGNAVTANYAWPAAATILYASGEATVGNGVEFPSVGGANVVVDFRENGFRISYPNGWIFNTVAPRTFDGWVVSDLHGTIPAIKGARVESSNISGFSSTQVTFDADHVRVNQLGYTDFPAGSYIDIAVDFPAPSLPSIGFIYGVASNGANRGLDVNGTLATSIRSWNHWLRGQTGGRGLRLDMRDGAPDIKFVRLNETEASYEAHGIFIRDVLEAELKSRGYLEAGKIYALYYDGPSSEHCGGAAYPPSLPGQVGALYLRGHFADPNIPPCSSNPFAPSPTAAPGYVEVSMLHEIMHTLGYVPSCSPHQVLAGHVGDDQHDLMYADPTKPWLYANPVLDFNHDDYYGHGRANCPDFANDPFLQASDYSIDYVQKSYVAYYGRPADPVGQNYWASRMDGDGGSLDAIIGAFGTSDEFNRRYGGLGNDVLVTRIYQQTLGRNPDPAGLDYYVGELEAGRRTLQSITLDVLNGATTTPDSTVVANKLDVAAYYSDRVAAGCAYGTEQDGVSALSGVTASLATVIAAKAAIDSRCGP